MVVTVTETLADSRTRSYIYGIAAVAAALGVGYGLIAESMVPAWLGLISALLAVLGNLTAITHTSSVGRSALYGLAAAVIVLLVGYGLLNDVQADLWSSVALAVFGIAPQGLALKNVTYPEKNDPVEDNVYPEEAPDEEIAASLDEDEFADVALPEESDEPVE